MRSARLSINRKGSNRVRIIGGEWRSRLLHFPDVPGLRPTPDRMRETLFNWLGQDLSGKRCLDLFAGAGALGFEARSRGAVEVVMVEKSRAAFEALRTNATRLAADRMQFVHGDALHFLATPGVGTFDIVFIDPPFGSSLASAVLNHIPSVLSHGGRVYVESDAARVLHPPWRVRRRAAAGAVHCYLVEWGEDDQSSVSGDV
jgi:16S rRNA (guanine966-N2)-methyltransferase